MVVVVVAVVVVVVVVRVGGVSGVSGARGVVRFCDPATGQAYQCGYGMNYVNGGPSGKSLPFLTSGNGTSNVLLVWDVTPSVRDRLTVKRCLLSPARAEVETFANMPRLEGRVSGEEIPRRVVEMLRENPDREQWLRRLRRSGAEYLVVVKTGPAQPTRGMRPAELEWAQADSRQFEKIFENAAGVVFRIRSEP